MSAARAPQHTQRLVASVYGWRTYQSWCNCCAPGADADTDSAQTTTRASTRLRSKPANPVLAWRTRTARAAE